MEKKDHILEVAESLFAELGFEGTSTRKLATTAGVNVAMISYYFGSKERLFEAIIEKKTAFMREKLQTLNQEKLNSWEKMQALIDLYVERIISNHKFHRILCREISIQQRSVMSEKVVNLMLLNALEVKKIIQDGINTKVFKSVDIPLTIATLMGTISQLVQSQSLAFKLMNEDSSDISISSIEFKLRMKTHLKSLFEAYLLKK